MTIKTRARIFWLRKRKLPPPEPVRDNDPFKIGDLLQEGTARIYATRKGHKYAENISWEPDEEDGYMRARSYLSICSGEEFPER